jgi:hypothetical protein
MALNNPYIIPLPAPDGCGIARAKRADQKSDEQPQQEVRYGFAGGVGSLPILRKNTQHAILGIGWLETGFCSYELCQVGLVGCRNFLLPKGIR